MEKIEELLKKGWKQVSPFFGGANNPPFCVIIKGPEGKVIDRFCGSILATFHVNCEHSMSDFNVGEKIIIHSVPSVFAIKEPFKVIVGIKGINFIYSLLLEDFSGNRTPLEGESFLVVPSGSEGNGKKLLLTELC
jgi:hypothetical protein